VSVATLALPRLKLPLLALAGMLVVAAGLRLALVCLQWPESNSDEGTIGIMALHIANGRDFPNFYYGQSYMGSAQAYLAAVLFTPFGPSLAAVRVGMVLLYLAFLGLLFVLARRLYSTSVGLAAVGLLVLGSRERYGSELVAIGGLPETLLAGVGLMLLSTTDKKWALAGWGTVAMLGLWSDMLVAPFVAGSAMLLWRARRGGLALVAGLLVGATPFLLHGPVRSLVSHLQLYRSGGSGLPHGDPGGLVHRLANTVGTSLSYATGGAALGHHADPPAWPNGWAGGWRPPTGNLLDAGWGLTLAGLWCAASAMTVRALRQRRDDPRLWGRLALLVSAGLTVAAFAASRAPGVSPANHSRYLIGVLVATPAIIHPLWSLRRSVRWAAIIAATAVLALGTADAFRDAVTDRGPSQQALAQALLDRGVTHVYAGYWTCNRLTFASRERVICAVVNEHPDGLHHGLDRYRPYRAAVLADPRAAYLSADEPPRVPGCVWRSPWDAAGYRVWQPMGRCVPLP
jgi:hypothetical protein